MSRVLNLLDCYSAVPRLCGSAKSSPTMANFMRKFSIKHKPGDAPARDSSPASPVGSRSSGSTNERKSTSEHADGLSRKSHSIDRVDEEHHTKGRGVKHSAKEVLSKLHLSDSPHGGHPINHEGEEMSKNQIKKHEQHKVSVSKQSWHDRQSADLDAKKHKLDQQAIKDDPPEMRARYGWLPVNDYSGQWRESNLLPLQNLSLDDIGKDVIFRARIHHFRKMSAKLAFFLLRQQTTTIQGVLQESSNISHHMVHWAEHIPLETVVVIKGTVQSPKAKEGEVTGAYIHDKEIMINEMHVAAKLTEHLPFSVHEAEVTQEEADTEGSTRHHVSDRARLEGRILDLRTTASQAIFRVQSGVTHFFRGYLDSQGFIEIHSPKLQGGATESGASVFKLDYFGRTAFLAQSPQLAKQMSIAADFGRVYEVGPVFRAENSNTHRHLTEYTGLDIEMAIDKHYHEALRMIDSTLKSIFEGVYKKYRPEIEVIKRQFPHEDLVWLEKTLVLPFKEAIQMLNETGWKGEDGEPLPEDEDLGTRDEIQMGRVIKEKYGTDYYIIDKFPTSARPFYTMQDPENPTYTNSFDVFVRGQEIISGGQRVHDAQTLEDQMKKVKVDPSSMEEYMQGFEWGAPPHAGAGIGLERILMLLLQLGDIRHASMYPRDPKSLPAKPPMPALRHPDASTLHPPWGSHDRVSAHMDLQPLEKLIANYGDASNTSWLESRNVIWRDGDTGAAVGYVPHNGFAITVGDPLCHENQYTKMAKSYLEFLKKETDLKPLWLLCGGGMEDVLSSKLDWRTFSCAAEQRMNLASGSPNLRSFQNPDIQRKIRHAEKEGVKIRDIPIGEPVTKDFRDKIDQRIQDWLGNRKGHQHVHLTEVTPWQDVEHRQYHYAVQSDGQIAALVVLAQLSPKHGWQVKYSLDFPGAPNGAIESLVIHALKQVQAKGETQATFGGGATNEFRAGNNLKGAKVKLLSRAYATIATELKLTQKSEFREKLGAEEDPIYICYPPKGLGPKGVQAILSFFEDQ